MLNTRLAPIVCGLLLAIAQKPTFSQSIAKGATDVTHADILTVLKMAQTDQQLKVVDIGTYNVGVGILHRGAMKSGAAGVSGLSHNQVTEVYYVVSGSGTLVTGGKIYNGRKSGPTSEVTKVLNGPSCSGTIAGADVVKKVVNVGDIVIIPAGTPHSFSQLDGPISYLVYRFEPSAK